MKPEFSGKLRLVLLLIFFIPSLLSGQTRTITGTVSDESGATLPGVSVSVVGTTKGTSTDVDGKYSIEAAQGDQLQFSFVGMDSQTITVGTESVINVTLAASVSQLEEVVVVGYGIKKKETVVGAVSQISGEQLMDMKTGGALENTLQGNLPGLVVVMRDPTPGEEANSITMQIRGGASMGNNTPLILVDGVERSFSNLDPNEIASIFNTEGRFRNRSLRG